MPKQILSALYTFLENIVVKSFLTPLETLWNGLLSLAMNDSAGNTDTLHAGHLEAAGGADHPILVKYVELCSLTLPVNCLQLFVTFFLLWNFATLCNVSTQQLARYVK